MSTKAEAKEEQAVEEQVQQTQPAELPIVLILRGLPGTGKTTLSNFLEGKGAAVISTDGYWSEANPFDSKKVNDSYKWCFERFKDLIRQKEKFIVVDNSNVKKFHYLHYVDYAQRNGYLAAISILPHNHLSEKEMSERSKSKVGQLTVRKLKELFEWEL